MSGDDKIWTAEEINKMWIEEAQKGLEKALKEGLGKAKEFDPAIKELPDHKSMLKKLKTKLEKDPFTKEDEDCTRIVAHAVGLVSGMIATGEVVDKHEYKAARDFVKTNHPACGKRPRPLGASKVVLGAWCDFSG